MTTFGGEAWFNVMAARLAVDWGLGLLQEVELSKALLVAYVKGRSEPACVVHERERAEWAAERAELRRSIDVLMMQAVQAEVSKGLESFKGSPEKEG